MMQLKSLTAIVLFALLSIALGCGEKTETPTEPTQLPPETPTLTAPEIAEIALLSGNLCLA